MTAECFYLQAEFDYLKSLEIEEKINCLRWCRPLNSSFLLLTTNDKTIKLWKVQDHKPAEQITSYRNGISAKGASHDPFLLPNVERPLTTVMRKMKMRF